LSFASRYRQSDGLPDPRQDDQVAFRGHRSHGLSEYLLDALIDRYRQSLTVGCGLPVRADVFMMGGQDLPEQRVCSQAFVPRDPGVGSRGSRQFRPYAFFGFGEQG